MTHRVIQWGTGATGSSAIRQLARRPELELVAVKVYNPAKAGQDAGHVCGIDPIGVIANADGDEVIQTPADVVLYMGSAESNAMQCIQDIIALLASGKNVIATSAPFQNPYAVDPNLGGAFDEACRSGGSSFLGLGLFPGYMAESLPITLSRICHSVERLRIAESFTYDDYPSHELMFDVMGFGSDPDDPSPMLTNLDFVKGLYVGAPNILAEALELTLDDVRPFRETVITETPLDVASGHIPAGTVAAIRQGVDAYFHGRPVITIEHCTRMDPDLAPDWPTVQGYSIDVVGDPTFSTQIIVGAPGEDHSMAGIRATAAHALNAIPAVVGAAPGVRTLANIGHFHGGQAFAR